MGSIWNTGWREFKRRRISCGLMEALFAKDTGNLFGSDSPAPKSFYFPGTPQRLADNKKVGPVQTPLHHHYSPSQQPSLAGSTDVHWELRTPYADDHALSHSTHLDDSPSYNESWPSCSEQTPPTSNSQAPPTTCSQTPHCSSQQASPTSTVQAPTTMGSLRSTDKGKQSSRGKREEKLRPSLASYVERFRKAPPTSREERGRDFLLKDGKFSPFEEPQTHSTPDNSGNSAQIDMNDSVKNPSFVDASPRVSDNSLDSRSQGLIHRGSSLVTSSLSMDSSLPAKNYFNSNSVERQQGCTVKEIARTATHPENDILYQWRLKRRLEDARREAKLVSEQAKQFLSPPVRGNIKSSLLPLQPRKHFSCDVVPYTCQAGNEINRRTGLTGTGTRQTSVGIGGACTGIEPNYIVTGTGLDGIGTEISGFGTGIAGTEIHPESGRLNDAISPRPQVIPVGKQQDKEDYYDGETCSLKVNSPKSPRKVDQIVQTDLQENSSNEPASKDDTTSSLCLGGDLGRGQGTSMNCNRFVPPLIGTENEQGTSMDISTVPPVMVLAKGQGTTVDIGTAPLPKEPETVINVPPLSGTGEVLVNTGCVSLPPPSGPAEGPKTLSSSNKAVEEANAVDQSLVSELGPVLVSPTHMIECTSSPLAIVTDCVEEKHCSGEVSVKVDDGGVDESSCWTVTPCASPGSEHPHSIGPLLNEVVGARLFEHLSSSVTTSQTPSDSGHCISTCGVISGHPDPLLVSPDVAVRCQSCEDDMGDDLLRLLIHKAHCFEAAIRKIDHLLSELQATDN